MPEVTVLPKPNGLPIARTASPTCTRSIAPNVIAGRFSPSAFSTAMSDSGSVPRTCARQATAVVQHELDVVGAFDDVMVGQHVAFGRHDDARPETRDALARHAVGQIRKVTAQQLVVDERAFLPHLLARVDVDDRGHGLFRGIRATRDGRRRHWRRRLLHQDDAVVMRYLGEQIGAQASRRRTARPGTACRPARRGARIFVARKLPMSRGARLNYSHLLQRSNRAGLQSAHMKAGSKVMP